MWCELLPLEFFKEFLADSNLPRAGQVHRIIPRNVAVIAAVRRLAVRLAASVALPDAVCAVRVTRGTICHAEPEHLPRPLGWQAVAQHFVRSLAIDHRHRGLVGVR